MTEQRKISELDKNLVYLVTHLPRYGDSCVLSACREGGRIFELAAETPSQASLLGNIYVGRVRNLAAGMQAAFVEIADGLLCYYPLSPNEQPTYVTEKKGARLVPGDELLVQVSREAVKTKQPTVTAVLSFPGKYLVVTVGRGGLGLSSRLSPEEKHRLRPMAEPFLRDNFGIIVRTNAAQATEEELQQELSQLSALAEQTVQQGRCRTAFSLVHREYPDYIARIRSLPSARLDRIITDDPAIHAEIAAYLAAVQPEDADCLVLYEKKEPSLAAVYGLGSALEEALQERVWLKSGGYLVIQPTEALTVVDVNSGKYSGNQKAEAAFLRINLEAAREIARQLRLRNLSGIIVVDFIDMREQSSREQLMHTLEQELRLDPVKTALVDMTPLGLVEITRKKTKKTLREQLPS